MEQIINEYKNKIIENLDLLANFVNSVDKTDSEKGYDDKKAKENKS